MKKRECFFNITIKKECGQVNLKMKSLKIFNYV